MEDKCEDDVMVEGCEVKEGKMRVNGVKGKRKKLMNNKHTSTGHPRKLAIVVLWLGRLVP